MTTDETKKQLIHDLRNPLNAALGITDILAGDPALTAAHQKKISVLKSSLEHLHEILVQRVFNETPNAAEASRTDTQKAL